MALPVPNEAPSTRSGERLDESFADAHARAIRTAARQELFDRLIAESGVPTEPASVTQPIPVLAHCDDRTPWMSR